MNLTSHFLATKGTDLISSAANSLLKGCHHDMLYTVAVVPSKKTRHLNMQQRLRTREQRAELRQKKYRYLYQVRTAHGDVISQVCHGSHPNLLPLPQTFVNFLLL
jgi:hypothetical protein